MSKIIHFEIPCKKAKRSIKFYKNVFKWKFKRWGDEQFWLINTGSKKEKGIDGSLIVKNEMQNKIINTISVKNIDKTIEKIMDHGGEILMNKTPVAGVGYLIYFRDPDKNMFGVMQEDKNAI
jgi:predicted enzyme related to lactoylglutathione lyase